MIDVLNVYISQFKTTFAVQLQYRIALLIWLIEMVLEPIVYLVVWSTVVRVSNGSINGYSESDFAAYYIAFMLVNHLTFSWIMWEFDYRIRAGMFSSILLRPIHPIHADIADNITYKSLTSFVMIPAAILLTLVFSPKFEADAIQLAMLVPSIFFAFILRFFFEWTLALAAFWTTRTSAVNQIYYVVLLFLSGEISPIALLPDYLQTIAYYSPFRWMISFPVDIALGHLDPAQILSGYCAQIGWISFAGLALLILWRSGVKRYTAVGA